ncbi:MAG: hypothetical protein IJ420_06250, partial [Lachnospiraceae bacterium]|nr:hypothetical protein [Lachnospiraceae bacterium]
MIDYKYGDLFLKNSIDKQIVIADDAGAVKITNKELYSQKFEITETLCSEEQLVFGSCEASVLKFTAANIFTSLKGKWVNVKMTMGGNTDVPLSLGRFKVESDKPTADRKKREYVAYDALYDVINTDVAGWYNTILPEKTSTTTMRQFRDSFFEYFDIEQEEITLINDTVTVKKTIEPESLSGKDVLFAICEINGCFGKMSREGKFRYVYLVQAIEGIYPSHDLYPSEDLYPGASKTRLIGSGLYIPPCVYEDYIVESISGLIIRKEEEDIGSQTGDMSNAYIIQDNFLVYGKSADELSTIGERIFEKIKSITYKPFSTKAKGNPCIEVGDAIRISTSLQKIETYVLQRTLSGIQAMRDTYSAEGEQKRDQKVNDISRSIVELKGKTNVLIRTVDETRSELADLEFDTETRFLQTADEISAEARRAQAAEAALSLRADEIAASVSDLDDDLTAKINLNAEEIAAEVKRADAAEAALSLRADEIAASVSDLDDEVTAEIKALSGQISLKVESDEVQSMIDISLEDITITADQIRLEGYTSING